MNLLAASRRGINVDDGSLSQVPEWLHAGFVMHHLNDNGAGREAILEEQKRTDIYIKHSKLPDIGKRPSGDPLVRFKK